MGCLIIEKGGVLSGFELICILEDDCSGLWWGFLVTECVFYIDKDQCFDIALGVLLWGV